MKHDPTASMAAARTWAIWKSGNFVGDQAPRGRVTVQVPAIRRSLTKKGRFATLWFNQTHTPMELPNVKSIEWSRSVDQDAADCTVELYNTAPLDMTGPSPDTGDPVFADLGDFDVRGAYTFNRGERNTLAHWFYDTNQWHHVLVPNRVLRTYQGYGANPELIPEDDPNLELTGTWLIDEVNYDSGGTIRLTCRDFAKALLEQIYFPPVIPLSMYPLRWEAYKRVGAKPPGPPSTRYATVKTRWRGDSNTPWVGAGNPLFGHRGRDAFDANPATYWLSVGNATPRADYAYEWVEGSVANATIHGVRFTPWMGNYVVYVSVYANGAWQGSNTVPYNPDAAPAAPNGANIHYVKKTTCGTGETTIYLGRDYHNVTRVRLTFHNLAYSHLPPYQYRAGVRSMTAIKIAGHTRTPAKPGKLIGNYSDYTDIVKWICATAGFYWPARQLDGSGSATVRHTDGSDQLYGFAHHDPVLGTGRAWGDFENTGTSGVADLSAQSFDKQPLMSVISHIRDIVSFIFYVTEDGAAVWRAPNIWQLGNWRRPVGNQTARTSYIPVIDEQQQLRQITVNLSDHNQRSKFFVGDVTGKIGATADGHEQFPIGLERVGGWTDQHFEKRAEAQIMADLIALRTYFTWRTTSVVIPGNPYLQPDDQVRLVDRGVGEAFVHYVKSIRSTWDAESGEWTMTLDTHWLGEQPFKRWAVDPAMLSRDTKMFLAALGKL